jgi:AbrB family looped-hinge helix DNA binding protein
MRTTDMVTISSKGQLVIPSKVRESMAIREQDKFMLVHDRDTILLKRVHEEKLKKRMKELVAKFRTGMEESAISKKDLEAVIRKARKQDA